MNKLVKLAIIMAMLSVKLSYSAEQLQKVMVWHIKPGPGVSTQSIRKLEEEIVKSLKATLRFSVLSLQKRDDFFNEVGAPSPDCITNQCFLSAGKLLGVDWILYGDVGETGDFLLLNLGIINARTGKVEAFFSKRFRADMLLRTAEEGVKTLLAQIPIQLTETIIVSPKNSAVLVVRSKPNGALVYLDAELIGRTPTASYEVTEGEHALTFVLEGYQTTHTPFTIKTGEVKEIEEILLMRTGDVEISSNPPAAMLYFDGKKVGPTPQKLEGVLVGVHEIRLEIKGYAPLITTITVDENSTQKRIFSLKKEGAKVLISSRPEGAVVLLDGKIVGNALYIGELAAGLHTITVRLPGYTTQSKQVELKSGGSYAFHFHLQPGNAGDSGIGVISSPLSQPPAVIAPQRRTAFSSSNQEAQRLYDEASANPDINERIKLYQQAIALDPKFAAAHNYLGVDYTELGHWDDAIREYRTALEIDPDYTFAHNNLGYVYLNTGRVEEAIAQFKEALRIDPNYVTAHFNLGKAYFILNDYEASLKEFETVIKLNPKHANAYFQIGRVLKRQERYDEAVMMYLKCLEIDPNYIHAYYNLGDIYDAKGDKQSAIYYFKKYISAETRPSEQEWVEKARERIRALGGEP